ncbi:hypothetical protein N7507_003104 [Penicillium longicatenatum]|nr:hypothetical protein N7507_003104 [Penicillium longicatenatum]
MAVFKLQDTLRCPDQPAIVPERQFYNFAKTRRSSSSSIANYSTFATDHQTDPRPLLNVANHCDTESNGFSEQGKPQTTVDLI